MSPENRVRPFSAVAFTCIVMFGFASTLASQATHSPAVAVDSQAQAALAGVIAGILSDTSSHMRMGPTRAATVADSARAAGIVLAARAALSQYADVGLAERDGYYRNMPWLEDQPIYHYNNARNFSAADSGAFDLARPVSLLYKKDGQGHMRLVGAMYAATASAAPDSLDALLPISMAHWHEHVNLCWPGPSVTRYIPHTVDARTVFWLKLYLSVTVASECRAAGGQFVPIEAGWMAHVYLFAGSDDPRAIWDADDVGNMEPHMAHPPT